MKGLILAGGLATRLRPLTWVTNKHLLPIYNKPMIYYPLQSLVNAGIKEILISTSPDHAGEFAKGDQIAVILGDNIFSYNLKPIVEKFKKQDKGAMIFGIKMPGMESKHYGVIEIDSVGKIISIVEKPENPKSNIAQTGIYIYDKRVFDFIRKQKPSARGELEVTDLNNFYLKEGTLECGLLDWWIDAGTSHDELLHANNLVAEKVRLGQL